MKVRKRLSGFLVRGVDGEILIFSQAPHRSQETGWDWYGVSGEQPFCRANDKFELFPLLMLNHQPLEVTVYFDVNVPGSPVQLSKPAISWSARVRRFFQQILYKIRRKL